MRCISAVLCLFLLTTLHAKVRLPALISDNMVLQQKSKVALWGWAERGEKVTITGSWNNKSITTTTGTNGKWQASISTTAAGGPYQLTFKGSNILNVQNVLLGEVWLASGQSNMEFFVSKTRNASYTGVINYEQEIKAANFPMIRQIDVANKNADEPQEDFRGDWKVCSPQTVDTFSAVAYYFARKVHQETGYPIGIINSTWGGTAAESWTKKEVLLADTGLRRLIERYDQQVADYPAASEKHKSALANWSADTTRTKPVAPAKPNPDKSPYRLYNAMIAPLVPYTLKGILWYQGESNATRAQQYQKLFPALINSWRYDFKNKNLPFYFVQISPHRSQNPEIREAQLLTYRNTPNTGIVVTTDNGDSLDIHPRNKKPVGERLSLWALNKLYGKKGEYSGPLYRSMKVSGDKIIIEFDHAQGLNSPQGLKEFMIAGADKHFVLATAVIERDKVVVSAAGVTQPVAVRYAWRNIPVADLFNGSGLPASPFRTDQWKSQTPGNP
ncbi:sialate O-acetylesterase [Segetibacter sp. 3557_3]|nr:sialate O-acetylesterase [Segetibacter sp. 3557_3]